jgi:hypothetical protein
LQQIAREGKWWKNASGGYHFASSHGRLGERKNPHELPRGEKTEPFTKLPLPKKSFDETST